ncbi:hypothetical protein MES4922_300072 [Mesorhizobium ventifaucium]|uniref:Uncharacterized protein n=1 Tax=Mesorhizobium ventifaucium TaxID=666020 RepID=A0ABM9E160_9HYPH|nr:hypothetical protein MES4922_300072 [Mesorhizobium ventifaucium]
MNSPFLTKTGRSKVLSFIRTSIQLNERLSFHESRERRLREICEAHFLLSRNGQFGTDAKLLAGLRPHANRRCVSLQPATEDGLNSIARDETELSQRQSAAFVTPERAWTTAESPRPRGEDAG